jgi:hypothetical protein
MTPKTAETRLAASLRRRIRQFYEHLNGGEFEKCYQMLDPTLRAIPSSVTRYQYVSSLERFRQWCGAVTICAIDPLQLHLNEQTRQYGNRDFALVGVIWEDQADQRRTFKERWVRGERGRWYTRSTGLVTPDPP